MRRGRKAGIVSLGCPKNLVDAEVMVALLEADGWAITAQPEEADLLLVNTCAFILPAKRESIETILEMASFKAAGRCRGLIVTGCLAQRYGAELRREMPEIDALVGTGEFTSIAVIAARVLRGEKPVVIGPPGAGFGGALPRRVCTPTHTAYLKIAEGCDNRCAYCVVPSVRGPLRSKPVDEVRREAQWLVAQGAVEIVVVAQDTTAYGVDIYGEPRLAWLLGRLAREIAPAWVRLMYAHPARVGEELLEVLAREPGVCRYLDIPLQHGSERILARMGRGGTLAKATAAIEGLRRAAPDVAVRTSLLVGFPGETEEDFRRTCELVARLRFDRLGVFTYSREEGTRAASLAGQVPAAQKKERARRLMQLQREISLAINRGWVGRTVRVLVERADDGAGRWTGRSEREAPEVDGKVRFTVPRGAAGVVCLRPGMFTDVRITAAQAYDLEGTVIV